MYFKQWDGSLWYSATKYLKKHKVFLGCLYQIGHYRMVWYFQGQKGTFTDGSNLVRATCFYKIFWYFFPFFFLIKISDTFYGTFSILLFIKFLVAFYGTFFHFSLIKFSGTFWDTFFRITFYKNLLYFFQYFLRYFFPSYFS